MIKDLIEKAKPHLTPRKITLFVVGHSVRFVISTAVSNLIHDEEDRNRDTARIFIGSYVISGMVSDKAEEWADSKIDELVAELSDAKAELETEEIVEPPAE